MPPQPTHNGVRCLPTRLVLDTKTVEERLQGFTRDTYFYIYGITKSVALGIAAIVIVTFFSEPSTLLPRLSFWLASIGAVLVSHATAARGVLLSSFRFTWLDVVVPLTMGLIECLLFTVLQPSSDPHTSRLWLYWYFFLAAHMALAVALVSNRLYATESTDFAPELRPLAASYESWLRGDATGAAVCALIVATVGAAMHIWIFPRYLSSQWWQFILPLLFLCMMAAVVAKAERERNQVVAFIRELPNT